MEPSPAANPYLAPSPYDHAGGAIADDESMRHPWHDANPMTVELSEMAWQQAIAAHEALMRMDGPTMGYEPTQCGQDALPDPAAFDVDDGGEGPRTDLEAILGLADGHITELSMPSLPDGDAQHQQSSRTLEGLAMQPFLPEQPAPMTSGMPMSDPSLPPQTLDDPMNIINSFMMGPGPGL